MNKVTVQIQTSKATEATEPTRKRGNRVSAFSKDLRLGTMYGGTHVDVACRAR